VYDEMVATLPGKNIWIVGGGELVGQFDDAGLLDEVWLGMRPVFSLLGGAFATTPDHHEAVDAPRGEALRSGVAADPGCWSRAPNVC